MPKIVLTGGGTAGHVTPNIALLPKLKELGYEIHYIGSKDGIEKDLITEQGIPYYPISSGKLRRYFDLKNFTDPFRILKGLSEAKKLMKKIKPDIVFSKGGFVSVPVVFAAAKHNVPIIIHESDMTPGLANKLSLPKATKVCCNFPETIKYLPQGKAVLSGSPIRKELFTGDKAAGLEFCNFNDEKPIMLIIGGSLGAVPINNAVRHTLDTLLQRFQIIHLCGKGNLDESLVGTKGYIQFEYIKEQLKDLMAAADIVISRAGANAICELLALKKPNILVPLSAQASRGDQILNAESFRKQGFSYVIPEEEMNDNTLLEAVEYVSAHRDEYIDTMAQSPSSNAVDVVVNLIESCRR